MQKTVIVIILLLVGWSCKKNSEALPKLIHNDIIVEQSQQAMVFKITGTNCYSCGTWGWDLFHELADTLPAETPLISVYARNGSLFGCDEATVFQQKFAPFAGTPAFIFNGVNRTVYYQRSVLVDQTLSTIVQAVDSFSKNTPLVAVGSKQSIVADSLFVRARVAFFQEVKGEYFLACYLIENNIPGEQSGHAESPYTLHPNVLRGEIEHMQWGRKIAAGQIAAGQKYDFTFATALPSSWNAEKITSVLVIWERHNDQFTFVNAFLN